MADFFNKSKVNKKEVEDEKPKERFLKKEGKLAIDLLQTDSELIVQSAIAGVNTENLDISVEGDTLTIRGKREKPIESGGEEYFYQECYWGPFSREIILPVEIDPTRIKDSMQEGILTVRMPIIQREKKRKIEIKGAD